MFEFGVEWYHCMFLGIIVGFILVLVAMVFFPAPGVSEMHRVSLLVPVNLP